MKKIEEANIQTGFGTFKFAAFADSYDEYSPDLAIYTPNIDFSVQTPLIRLHSECLTGDIFHSMRCDCGQQLQNALHQINKEGGILLYLRQEGRGIGLINKLKAYNLQDEGEDNYEANIHLGFKDDARDYTKAINILKNFNVKKIRLLTNNPLKIAAFDNTNIEVIERIPLIIPSNDINKKYLHSKKEKKGHLLDK